MIIAIMGPQGSGKGTQASKLAAKYNLHYIDVGATLREIAKSNTEIDAIINQKGALMPDSQVFEVVSKYLSDKGIKEDILFDGYPRSIEQYNLLNSYLNTFGKKLEKVIFLTIPDEVAISRLSARRINRKTGEIYNIITNPPPTSVDPNDLEQRPDDTPEAIKYRLDSYHKQTQPLIEHLSSQGMVIEIDGTQEIETIFEQICQKLN